MLLATADKFLGYSQPYGRTSLIPRPNREIGNFGNKANGITNHAQVIGQGKKFSMHYRAQNQSGLIQLL